MSLDRFRLRGLLIGAIAALGTGCSTPVSTDAGADTGTHADAGPGSDTGSSRDTGSTRDTGATTDVSTPRDTGSATDVVTPPDDVPAITDTGVDDVVTGATDSGPPPLMDNADIVSDTFPAMLPCNGAGSATVTVRNSGTSTWTAAGMFALGAVGGSDPFTGTPRINVGAGQDTPPGGTLTFTIDLTAPPMGGTYTSDWQMLHDPNGAFGQTFRHDVVVACPAGGELDLHQVTLSDNPTNIADWPITTTLTRIQFTNDGIHVEFSKRDDGSWPDIMPPGWDGPLEYTVGMAEFIDGQWYGSAAIQFWRGLYAEGGNVGSEVLPPGSPLTQCPDVGHNSDCQVAKNWYYDGRWGALAGYQPSTGETIGIFVVAGNLRGVPDGSQSPVQERSNVVLVPMPDINGADYTF